MIELVIAVLLALKGTHLQSGDAARSHVAAAQAAATAEVPAEVLLAIAYNETKFDVLDVSVVRGKFFCGITQANAGSSRARCRALRDPEASYRQTVRQLTRRMTEDMPGEPLVVVLAGYACGKSYRAPKCQAYAGRVLRLARTLTVRPTS